MYLTCSASRSERTEQLSSTPTSQLCDSMEHVAGYCQNPAGTLWDTPLDSILDTPSCSSLMRPSPLLSESENDKLFLLFHELW